VTVPSAIPVASSPLADIGSAPLAAASPAASSAIGAGINANPLGNVGALSQAAPNVQLSAGEFGTNTGESAGSLGKGAAGTGGGEAGLPSAQTGASAIGGNAAKPSGGFLGGLGKNPMALASTGMMGMNMLKGNQQPAYLKDLQGLASHDRSQGQLMESYLQSGTLPTGMQAGVNAGAASEEAAIRSQYAQHGMSGSSAEAQDIASSKQRALSQGQQIATQLFNTGVSETNAAEQIYAQLMQVQMQQDQQLTAGLSNFVHEMALMGQAPVPGG
jgi:hypothetical protein